MDIRDAVLLESELSAARERIAELESDSIELDRIVRCAKAASPGCHSAYEVFDAFVSAKARIAELELERDFLRGEPTRGPHIAETLLPASERKLATERFLSQDLAKAIKLAHNHLTIELAEPKGTETGAMTLAATYLETALGRYRAAREDRNASRLSAKHSRRRSSFC
jgi:hypothetical protein